MTSASSSSSAKRNSKKAHTPPVIKPKTKKQHEYLKAIDAFDQVFGVGPAGTGKTYLSSIRAAQSLQDGKVDRIVLCRPAVEAGERLGFLPGSLLEKMEPWTYPIMEAMEEILGGRLINELLRDNVIRVTPFAYMQGRTFRRSFVILDEAQNTTPFQMMMFLTRIGEESKVVVNGDPAQSLIRGKSGLVDALEKAYDNEIPVGIVEFAHQDVIRSELCARWVEAYQT